MIERMRTRGAVKYVRLSLLIVIAGILLSILIVFKKYQHIVDENVQMTQDHIFFYISTGMSYEEVRDRLYEMDILKDESSFDWVAKRKEYPSLVKAGRYRIGNGMSNNELINMLRAGNEAPVMLIFNNIRTFEQLAGKVSKYIQADSLELLKYLRNPDLPGKYGFTPETFSAMFIPNTYEMFWSSSAADFTDRMAREYEKFWESRDKKLAPLNMTREEVITLASIVDEETSIDDENARVAGLYINRLKQGIPLQADPTLKFALGDFTIKRILNADKEIDSPYNTYKKRGLPPGPISIPSIAAIDGVLNYEKHNFLFMCAKDDFSGYHAFARTLRQHNQNAEKYRRELNKRGIYR